MGPAPTSPWGARPGLRRACPSADRPGKGGSAFPPSRERARGTSALARGSIVIAADIECRDEIPIDDRRSRIELPRPLELRSRFGEAPGIEKVESIPMVTGRVSRPELDGALELALGRGPVETDLRDHCERGVALGQRFVQRNRL